MGGALGNVSYWYSLKSELVEMGEKRVLDVP